MTKTDPQYVISLELLVQAYRTDYELCILCGGDLDTKTEDKEAKDAMMCSDCVEHAKEGEPLKLKELE